jgi:hypothetical protein
MSDDEEDNLLGPEEVTPRPGYRYAKPGEYAQLTTGEHRLVNTVVKRERRTSWLKAVGVAGAAIAIMQFINSQGPCSTGWKFQSLEAAAAYRADNEDDHTAIRKETATAIQEVSSKIDEGNRTILKAVLEIKKGKNK